MNSNRTLYTILEIFMGQRHYFDHVFFPLVICLNISIPQSNSLHGNI